MTKVLHRPMFARTKTGGLKKILYAKAGVSVDKYRPREQVKSQWGKFFDFLNPFGGDYNIVGRNDEGKFYSQAIEDITGADAATREIKKKDPERKLGLFEYLPFYSGLGDLNFKPEVDDPRKEKELGKKIEAPAKIKPVGGMLPGGKHEKAVYGPGALESLKGEDDAKSLGQEIKSGSMDDMIKERIGLFEKYLNKDSKDRMKAGAWQSLTEFGLNMASSKGDNFVQIVAESAKDPLKTFTSLGKEVADRAEKIKMAGVESGVGAYEKALDRALTREEIEAENRPEIIKVIEGFKATNKDFAALPIEAQIRLAKTKAVRGQQEYLQDVTETILKNEDAINMLLGQYADQDGNLPEGLSLESVVSNFATNLYNSITGGTGGGEGEQIIVKTQEDFDALPDGTVFYQEVDGVLQKRQK